MNLIPFKNHNLWQRILYNLQNLSHISLDLIQTQCIAMMRRVSGNFAISFTVFSQAEYLTGGSFMIKLDSFIGSYVDRKYYQICYCKFLPRLVVSSMPRCCQWIGQPYFPFHVFQYLFHKVIRMLSFLSLPDRVLPNKIDSMIVVHTIALMNHLLGMVSCIDLDWQYIISLFHLCPSMQNFSFLTLHSVCELRHIHTNTISAVFIKLDTQTMPTYVVS